MLFQYRKVNKIGEAKAQTLISPKLTIEALVYVDDIGGAGSKENTKIIGENLQKMEQRKGFTFSVEKSNYMVVQTGNSKKENEDIDIKIKKGQVRRTREYKYLGNWIDTEGNVRRQIEEVERKVMAMEREMKRISSEMNLGRMSTEGRLIICERTVVPAMTYNLETWTKIWRKEWEQLEKIQGKILKRLLELPETTPTWGILKETGIWPI